MRRNKEYMMRRVSERMNTYTVILSFNSISLAFIQISEDCDYNGQTVRQNNEVLLRKNPGCKASFLLPSLSDPFSRSKEPGR